MSPEQSPNNISERTRDALPLTTSELERLIVSTVDKLRDRALILTILAARPTTEEIKEMRKEDLKTTEVGTTTLALPDRKIKLPTEIASVLNRYKETVNTTTLFPAWPKKHDSEGISRQTVDNIIKRHCHWSKLGRKASHGVLIDTANQILIDARTHTETPTKFQTNAHMTPESSHALRTDPEPEKSNPQLAEVISQFLQSERFTNLSRKSKRGYAHELRKFEQFMKDIDVFDVNSAANNFLKFANRPWSGKHFRELAAIRSTFKWAASEGLLQEDAIPSLYQNKSTERRHKIHSTPLDQDQLSELIENTKKLRDKALISTIIITRVQAKALGSLNTASIHRDGDGNTFISARQVDIHVPKEFVEILTTYKETVPKGPLFPSRNRNKFNSVRRPLTRQAVDIILKECRDNTPGIQELSHNVLVATGIKMLGELPNN